VTKKLDSFERKLQWTDVEQFKQA